MKHYVKPTPPALVRIQFHQGGAGSKSAAFEGCTIQEALETVKRTMEAMPVKASVMARPGRAVTVSIRHDKKPARGVKSSMGYVSLHFVTIEDSFKWFMENYHRFTFTP